MQLRSRGSVLSPITLFFGSVILFSLVFLLRASIFTQRELQQWPPKNSNDHSFHSSSSEQSLETFGTPNVVRTSEVLYIVLWHSESTDVVRTFLCNFLHHIDEGGGGDDRSVLQVICSSQGCCSVLRDLLAENSSSNADESLLLDSVDLVVKCESTLPDAPLEDVVRKLQQSSLAYSRIVITIPNVVMLVNPWIDIQRRYRRQIRRDEEDYSASVFFYSLADSDVAPDDPKDGFFPCLFFSIHRPDLFRSSLLHYAVGVLKRLMRLGLAGFSSRGISTLAWDILGSLCAPRGPPGSLRFGCHFLERISFTSTLTGPYCSTQMEDLYGFGKFRPNALFIPLNVYSDLPSALNPVGFVTQADDDVLPSRQSCTRLIRVFRSPRMAGLLLRTISDTHPAKKVPLSPVSYPVGIFNWTAPDSEALSLAPDAIEEIPLMSPDSCPSGGAPVPPAPDDPLFRLLELARQQASPKNALILLVTNYGFLPFFHNFQCYLQRVFFSPKYSWFTPTSYVVIATDRKAYDYLSELHYPVFYNEKETGLPEELSKTHSYNTKSYNRIVKQKPFYLYFLLRHGFNVLVSDLDIVMYKDPSAFLLPSTEILVSEDSRTEWGTNLNTGFLFVRNTSCAVETVAMWIKRNDDEGQHEDQQVFNQHGSNFLRLNVHSIPRMQYMPKHIRTGKCKCLASDVGPVAVHWNWIDGSEEKRRRMERWGDWVWLEEQRTCRNETSNSPFTFRCSLSRLTVSQASDD
mmetsp:Transcript_53519/g.88926  ORF Transcript_53519/g.88926 Transcript_53519/m.88926 type:complete len:744 (-) Transcript_53519:155-2386(-)